MHNFLFLLRADPDVDHIAPMIWKSLEEGDRAIVIFETPYPIENDYRLTFLRKYPRFSILRLRGTTSRYSLIRIASRIFWNYYSLKSLLRGHQISACFFEWGCGVEKEPTFISTLVHRFLRTLRSQLFVAARDLNIPRFSLPHGLSTKLNGDVNDHVISLLKRNEGQLPFRDRNSFTAYVFTSEYHRRVMMEYGGMLPEVSQTWGSLRFSREWMRIIKQICPAATLPEKRPGQIRAVFFIPKWHNRVHREATISLLISLAERDDLRLVLKTHPRKGEAELDDALQSRLLKRENVTIAHNLSSPALITWADVAIDIGSSIAIDVVLQRKHLIYPAYLHDNRLVFDEYGGCLIARNSDEVHGWLDRIANGDLVAPSDPETEPAIQHSVYAGREAFDVCDYYYSQVQNHIIQVARGKTEDDH